MDGDMEGVTNKVYFDIEIAGKPMGMFRFLLVYMILKFCGYYYLFLILHSLCSLPVIHSSCAELD